MSRIEDFSIAVPQSELDDLRERLRHTRWPEAETVDDWSQGVPLVYMRRLSAEWSEDYDWRDTQARLNALPHVRTEIDGLRIHAVHARSPHADAMPLILTHGWPGSFMEFEKIIGPLTRPDAHGGSVADAFHVVCPSLPGYGFSDKPATPGWGVQRIAAAWAELMARLGYDRYGAGGSDWGTSISTLLALQDADHVVGIHLVPPLAAPDAASAEELTEAERTALAELSARQEHESAYSELQATKPQTIGYSLVDSPIGLCAWIAEKFWTWSDHEGDLERVISRREVLDTVTLYWLTRSGASSARLYWESIREVASWFTAATTDVVTAPTGCTIFPKEVPRPSRRWAAERYVDIRHWGEPTRGGHFAALEQPDILVSELRTFFGGLRGEQST
jgi:pimeloyl-ACP methyl ester carboxylesterase